MRKVKDCRCRCVCMVDDKTGFIEQKYKDQTTTLTLPVGCEYAVERDDIITILHRASDGRFEITSYKKIA